MKWMVLGSHKGLGAEVVNVLLGEQRDRREVSSVVGISRRDEGTWKEDPRYTFLSYDFAKDGLYEGLLTQVQMFAPEQIVYCAGGGPFGPYGEQKWHSHEWAYNVNMLLPAKLSWYVAAHLPQSKFTFIGSSIAESEMGDAAGPSYAAAKWAMRGLITSLQADYPGQFYLYSPGYMDTDMLPPKSGPRERGDELLNPHKVAQDLISWILSSPKNGFHKTL